jgi:hypothetical protein
MRRRLALAALSAGVLATIATAAVLAQSDLGGKLRTGQEVRVGTGETLATDLYAFGGTIVVDGTVQGDVVATGGTVAINGTVEGDVLAAGGTVSVAGSVTGDVRAAGGTVTVSGSVGEDAVVAGGQVDIGAGGSVGEDVIVSAGRVSVAGSVGGSITGTAGSYQRTGTVGGTDDVVVGEGDPQPPPQQEQIVDRVLDAVQHFVAVLLLGLLALWLAPRVVTAAESLVRERPIDAVAWGVAAFVGFVVLIVVIAVVAIILAVALAAGGLDSLAGLEILFGIVSLMALSLAYAVAAFFLADAVVGLALARLVDGRRRAGTSEPRPWAMLLARLALGAAVVVIVTSLPIVGPWLKVAVVILGTGALLGAAYRWWRGRPAPAAATG